MWIHRQTSFIKPGLMDQAFAHAASQPVPEGMTRRILRPISGSESTTKLVIERGFSGDTMDAVYAAVMKPEPADEYLLKWITLNENRGTHELLRVVHESPATGKPGPWVDRRIVVAPPGRRTEAIGIWSDVANVPVEGFSFRLLTPRTGLEAISQFVAEWTFGRLEEWEEALAAHLASPEIAPILARWNEMNPYRSTWELYRVIG